MRGRGKREQRRHVHYIPQFENEFLPLLLVECHKCASRFSFGPYYQSLPHCCCQDLICIALSRLKGRGSEFPLSSGVVEMEMEESGENGAVQAKMVQTPMACTCIFRDLGIRVNGPRNEVWKFQQGTKCSSSNKVRSAVVPTKFAGSCSSRVPADSGTLGGAHTRELPSSALDPNLCILPMEWSCTNNATLLGSRVDPYRPFIGWLGQHITIFFLLAREPIGARIDTCQTVADQFRWWSRSRFRQGDICFPL